MKKDKLLFITRKWAPGVGGMETYSMKFAIYMKAYFDVTVLKPKVCVTGKPSLFSVFLFLCKCIWFLVFKSRTYKVVHLGDGVLYPLAFITGLFSIKTFITFHGLDIQLTQRKSMLGYMYKLYMSLLPYAPITCAFPNSRYTQSLLPMKVNSKVVTLGTDLPFTEPKPRDFKKPFHIVFVGRLIERKGIFWFLDNVFPKLNNVTLTVVGPIPKEVDFNRLQTNYPKVVFTGGITSQQLHEERRKANIFIVPNITTPLTDVEGFGLVCVENATYGVPVLASNWQGIKDAVIEGSTGFLIEPENVHMWVKKISQISHWSSNDLNQYAHAAQKNIERYSWTNSFKTLISYYNNF